jgi:hypothetical protein
MDSRRQCNDGQQKHRAIYKPGQPLLISNSTSNIVYLKTSPGQDKEGGNSGIFLAALPWGPGGYEIQVLDNYKNTTYVNGQAGSMYKQAVPLANACKKPGEWQYYDIVWTAPKFSKEGILKSPARITAFHNGVLVQNNTTLLGDTPYIGQPRLSRAWSSPD